VYYNDIDYIIMKCNKCGKERMQPSMVGNFICEECQKGDESE